jgi:hypothetical protein
VDAVATERFAWVMLAFTFQQLWSKLSDGDESILLEVKRASEIGKSIAETVSSFSNEPDAGGGVLPVRSHEKGRFPVS